MRFPKSFIKLKSSFDFLFQFNGKLQNQKGLEYYIETT